MRKVITGLGVCFCVRSGYTLLLCPLHAPIPFTVTDRGRRECARLTEWEVIEPKVRAGAARKRAELATARAAGRRVARGRA